MTSDPPVAAATRPGPMFSVLVPVYRTPLRYLRLMIDSVLVQTERDFELILVDDGSDDPELTAELDRLAEQDRRILSVALERNGGIVRASARGLEVATGEFVALVDHDDELLPDALELFAAAIRADPEVDYLYSDEAIIDPDGELLGNFRKPDFSPTRLLGQMYTGHLAVFRRALLDRIGGFRNGFDGSQDYDLVLRVTEQARAIEHIPHALYRWRTLPTSVSHSDNNEHVFAAARRALTEHLDRTGTVATVVQTDSTGRYRIDRELADGVRVDVVIPDTGGRTFAGGADRPSLPSMLAVLAPACSELPGLGVVIVSGSDPFPQRSTEWPGSWLAVPQQRSAATPAAINSGVAASSADYVVLVTEGLGELSGPDLVRLVSMAADRRIGAVGPILIDGAGRLASAGVTFTAMAPEPIGSGCELGDPGPFGALQIDRDVLALAPGVLVVQRELFLSVGGLSVRMDLPAALIDLCFKTAALGRRTVVSADASAVFDRPAPLPTATHSAEIADRWRRAVTRDPFWV